jgi:pyrroloquinoline quinone biosynthesis protein D
MNAITPSSVLRPRSDVRWRRIEGEAVVLRQSSAEVLVLNEVGASVLDLADGERSVAAWIQELTAVYDADPDDLARDVLEFAAELSEAGLLEPVTREGPR